MNKIKNYQIVLSLLTFNFSLLTFNSPARAVTPNGVREMPPVIYEMLDCSNTDFGQTHPEWGPVGGWRDFGGNAPGCTGGNAIDYLTKAKKMTVTLTDGTKIPKPVGVGWRVTSSNIGSWSFLNNPEYSNLAFIAAESPSIYGEVTGGYTLPSGDSVEDTLGWAKSIMGPLAQAFPSIPIFFQSCGYASELLSFAKSNNLANIGVKCNGWYVDSDNAMSYTSQGQYSATPCRLTDGVLTGGAYGFASVYHSTSLVGFEPKHGLSVEQWYWGVMQALAHHPDIVDVDTPDIIKFAAFGQQYGFNLINFLSIHLGKTLTTAPDLWVILRETQVGRVRECGSGSGTSSSGCDCCWRSSSTGSWTCVGPQRGNLSYWLYQLDNLPGGKTVVLNQSDLPSPAKSHPYGLYTSRRTDQATGNPFMYFDIDDRYQLSHSGGVKANAWEITVTFVNKGSDKLSIEYINKSDRTTKKSITKGVNLGPVDNWVDYKWTLADADFSGKKMSGADFRINSEGDGDEIVHRVLAKPITVSFTSSPTPIPSLAASPSPMTKSIFRPGWQEIDFQISTKIPNNCSAITFKENGFWQTFTSYLGNLLFAPRKRRVWIKCN